MKNQNKEELFEQLSIPKAVAALSLPTVASCLVGLLYSLADTYFVGILNAPVQTAAVTLAAPVLLAFNAVNNLFGVGSSSMMSRALGAKDMDTLRASSAFGFYGALFCGALFSVLCAVFMPALLSLLGADADTAADTASYLRWTVCLGAIPSILNVVFAYMVRSEGSALHASIGSISGCLLNIILDPFFILPWGLDMGASGAALATFISNCVAMLYFFGYLILRRGKTLVCISPKAFTLRREITLGVCGVGVPASIQNILNVASHTILNNLAAPFGAAALAAMGISAKIAMIPMYIAMGISQGVMPLVSYNFAAKNPKRMESAISFTAVLSGAILLAVALLTFLLPGFFTGLFIDDAQTVAYGARFLKGFALSVPLLGADFLAVGVFQAVGLGRNSLIQAVLRKAVFEIPALYLLNALFPLYGLAYAQTIAELFLSIIGTVLLLRFLRRNRRQLAE